MKSKRISAAVGAGLLLVMVVLSGQSKVVPQDGKVPHCFFIPGGTSQVIKTKGNGEFDLDFDNDGTCDVNEITNIIMITTAGSQIDTLGINAKFKMSGGSNWIETGWPAGAATAHGIDMNEIRLISRSGVRYQDSTMVVRANNGDVALLVTCQ